MCGICGFIPSDAERTPERELLKSMCDTMLHRGPDASGVFVAPGVGLGHQRLKIIDLSTGQQPMSDPSGRYTIVFNGEIYNYQELRKTLRLHGHVFRTQSDTEVLLYGLITKGVSFLEEVNGMFAFGLWDAHKKMLLVASDRFGVKPLYWGNVPGQGFLFASEASAIALAKFDTASINNDSLYLFLGLSYIPGEDSIFNGIKRLLPGAWLTFSEGQKIKNGHWWNTCEEWHAGVTPPPRGNWHEAFSVMLDDAVKIRLKSDVPLGSFLSGGVDSAVITALAQRHQQDLTSFTMAFSDLSHNEAPYARQTAEIIGTRHFEELAEIGGTTQLLEVASKLDEPFADTSIIPMQALCGLAKKQVAVALTGDGADELLGGYITLHADMLYNKIHALPSTPLRLLRAVLNLLPENRRKVSTVFKLKQFLAAYPREKQIAHACWRLIFYPDELKKVIPEVAQIPDIFGEFRAAWEESSGLPELDRFLYMDYKIWLAHDILFKADRASMQKSIELRSPFLDYRLFRLCSGMPPEYKRQGAVGKKILRDIARKILPLNVLNRPKAGFNVPVAQWLCTNWLEVSEDCFNKQTLEAYELQPERILLLWRQHKHGKYNHGFKLFNIMMYILWRKVKRCI